MFGVGKKKRAEKQKRNKTEKRVSGKPKLKFGKSKEFKGRRGFTNPRGYRETDAYILNDHAISAFDVIVQYGTNNPANIGWLCELIPTEQLKNGRAIFISRELGMDSKSEQDIVDKRLHSQIVTLEQTQTSNARESTQNTGRRSDLKTAAKLTGQQDTIVDSDVVLLIKAKTPELVEATKAEIQQIYADNGVAGIMFARHTGFQMEVLEELFMTTAADAWHHSDMSSTTAGKAFFPSSGFSDAHGVFVGYDVFSVLSNNRANIDFSNVRNAVIFMGGVLPYVSIGADNYGSNLRNGGSVVAETIADRNYLAGNRTHHIVLSGIGYYAPDNLVFDMSKEVINPLEVYGSPETVQADATANFDKVVTMLLIAANVLDNKNMYADLMDILVDWMINRANGGGLYTDDPGNEPARANRILATKNHENYPVSTDLLSELSSNLANASKPNHGEDNRNRAEYLYKTMKTTFRTYKNIFGTATTLPDVFKPGDRNIYYDLTKTTQDKKLKGALFLNVMAYVTGRALEGEQIVIHGLDDVEVPVKPLIAYKDRISEKNIGLVTVFNQSENKEVNPSTFSRFTGRLSNQDAVILGGLTEEELTYINKSWRRDLPVAVSQQLMQATPGILYFYRRADRLGALIDTHFHLFKGGTFL